MHKAICFLFGFVLVTVTLYVCLDLVWVLDVGLIFEGLSAKGEVTLVL